MSTPCGRDGCGCGSEPPPINYYMWSDIDPYGVKLVLGASASGLWLSLTDPTEPDHPQAMHLNAQAIRDLTAALDDFYDRTFADPHATDVQRESHDQALAIIRDMQVRCVRGHVLPLGPGIVCGNCENLADLVELLED